MAWNRASIVLGQMLPGVDREEFVDFCDSLHGQSLDEGTAAMVAWLVGKQFELLRAELARDFQGVISGAKDQVSANPLPDLSPSTRPAQ